MLRAVRAGLAAALLTIALASVAASANAAEKPFKQSALDEAAIKLEAQIKSDAGTVAKPAAALRRDADAAFQKNDFRSGMVVLSQLVTVAPRMRQTGCVSPVPFFKLSRATIVRKRCCSIAHRRLPISPISGQTIATRRPTACQSLAGRSPIGGSGAARSIPCASRSNCARLANCAANMKRCGPSMDSDCSTLPSTRTRYRREPASSSRRNYPAAEPISHPLCRSRAWIGQQ